MAIVQNVEETRSAASMGKQGCVTDVTVESRDDDPRVYPDASLQARSWGILRLADSYNGWADENCKFPSAQLNPV